jgi:hypothetical protein
MEIKISARQVWNVLLVLSWIIFAGICIEAGSFLVNAFFALANPGLVNRLWQQVDLSALFNYDHGHFFVITLIMGIVAVMKALMFFLIIKTLHNKDLNFAQPFNTKIRRFIFCLSYLALGIGFFSSYGVHYSEWLVGQGVHMPDTQYLRLGGADVWLFMAVILFIIAQIFKRGIEIQSEHELTI